VGGALLLAAIAGGSFPFWYTRSAGPIQHADQALSNNQIMRGPYVNTGSKDIGPDVPRK
jgi:hypothetical protein